MTAAYPPPARADAHHPAARIAAVCVVGLSLFAHVPAATAQEGHCDPGLRVAADNPVHYQPRGSRQQHNDRCEGVYVREVAGTTLLVASFTAAFGAIDMDASEPLRIRWPVVAEPVRLRAYSLRERLYYRMDSRQPQGVAGFTWPIGVLAALNAAPGDIGITGWVQRKFGTLQRAVYLPLEVSQRGAPTRQCCRVALLPGRELEEVYLTLAPVDATGARGRALRENVPLKYGYYPAGRSIVLPITGMTKPGVYVAEIAATLRGGGSAGVELWFYNPPPLMREP